VVPLKTAGSWLLSPGHPSIPLKGPSLLVVTTNDIPDREIQRVCGELFGMTVRSRNAFAQMGGGRSLDRLLRMLL
jgi:hypothetical protein